MMHRNLVALQLLPFSLLVSSSFATDYNIIAGDALVPTSWSPSAAPIIAGTNITPLSGDRLVHTFTNNTDQILNPGANIVINAGAEIVTQGTPAAGQDGNNRAIRPHLFLAGTGTDGLGALKNTGGGWVQVSSVDITANATVSLTGGGWRHDDHGTGANVLNLNGNTLTVTGNQGVWFVNTTINGPGTLNAMNTAEFNFEGASILPANVTMNLGSGTLNSSWDGGGRVMLGNVNTSNNSIIEARYNDLGKTYNGTISMAAGNTSFRTNDNGGGGGSLVINGQVTGAGRLVKDGGASVDLGTTRGIVTLNNPTNNYTGGTRVDGGVLRIGAAGAIPANSLIDVTAGSLDLNGFNQSMGSGTISGTVTGGGTLNLTGAGIKTITAGAVLNNAGGVNLSGGTLATLDSNALAGISGPLVVSENATLKPSNQGLGEYHRVGADLFAADDGTAGATFSGVKDGIPAIDSTAKPYGDNNKFVYSGSIVNTTGANIDVTFGEQYDDQIRVKIDGATVLLDGGWNTATASSLVPLTPGAHTLEISSFDGVGGAGPNSGWDKGVGIRVGPYSIVDPAGGGDNAAFNRITAATLPAGLVISTGANVSESKSFTINAGKTLTVDTSNILGVVGGGSYTLSGNISGSGRIAKTGAGNLILSGTTTTRNASVIQGTLVLNGTHAFNSISVASGATLEGTGSAASAIINVDVGAEIAPGNSVGTITVGTVSINGSYAAEASGNGVNDLIVGDVIWGGTGTFDLTLTGGYVPALGDSFDFVDGFIDGPEPTFNLPDLGFGKMFDTAQFMSDGILTVIIPEPGSALLSGLGLVLLARRRR